MSYSTIATMKDDELLHRRIMACAAQERESRGVSSPSHDAWTTSHIWGFVTRSDWVSAYQYALDTAVVDPGNRADVVSDAMILAAVQPVVISETRL